MLEYGFYIPVEQASFIGGRRLSLPATTLFFLSFDCKYFRSMHRTRFRLGDSVFRSEILVCYVLIESEPLINLYLSLVWVKTE